ncbi:MULTISPECIES: TraR/DksA family transcriptional regulator [Desertihabitans]|uniref:TraR/DksA family transcriptional regulator n=1 Tax=Desertihabitans brevis TaxID=2268447 RepID=A0A367YXP5_9ACTN|nr:MULTISPECIES: TraR/DksA C4-type zinc finger protein [Desertihabitans]RCK70598.1 TraR/DksA family transcriptional regulator [Desertihabitans brevis]
MSSAKRGAAGAAKDLSWRTSVDPAALPFRDGEEPWTSEEVHELIEELLADIAKQEAAVELAEHELADMRDGTDGAGRDPADVGANNFERDQEMTLAHSAREMLEQGLVALRSIRDGHYGACENCGQPIGKGRLQVFPRATLCVTCKQREERR